MRVILHDEAVREAREMDSDALVLLVLEGRHHCTPADTTMPALDAHLQRRDWAVRWEDARERSDRELSARRVAHIIEVVPQALRDHGANPPRLAVADAVRLLREPLRVMVENGRNDGAMLRALATIDPDLAAHWDVLLRDRHVELDHGGGLPEMHERLRDRLRDDPLQRLRYFALFDSDAVAPDTPSAPSCALRDWCRPRNRPLRVGHHQLQRRAAENYLPPPALTRWSEAQADQIRRRGRAWSKLSPPQRHHYAMRDGLKKDAGDPKAESLFASLEAGQRTILREGFGRAVRDLFDARNPDWARWMRLDEQADEVRALFGEILARV